MAALFEIFEDEAGEFRWRLKAANGEVLATSEGYTRREDARRGVQDFVNAVGHPADPPEIKEV